MNPVLITKADGEREPFRPEKLEQSLEHAGASSVARARILSHVMRELREGMMTEEIYRHAFELLQRDEELPIAARYSMKRAVFALGPSGFPFEHFFAELLRAHGWKTRVDVMLMGRCATHEVDVLAEKGARRAAIEAKFHNDPGGKTDIQTALYVHARHEDLSHSSDPSSRIDEGWLVTNTRFTQNAVRYAQCSNLTLIAWDYPRGKGLISMIEAARAHPITALTTLSESEKRRLLEKRVALARELDGHLLAEAGVRPSSVSKILEEARRLMGQRVVAHAR